MLELNLSCWESRRNQKPMSEAGEQSVTSGSVCQEVLEASRTNTDPLRGTGQNQGIEPDSVLMSVRWG